MKAISILFMLIAATLSSAQFQCVTIAAQIPSCGVSCLSSAASAVGCAQTDFACQCSSSQSSAINSAALDCIVNGCGAETGRKVSSSAQAVCSCIATAGSGTPSTFLTSTTSTTSRVQARQIGIPNPLPSTIQTVLPQYPTSYTYNTPYSTPGPGTPANPPVGDTTPTNVAPTVSSTMTTIPPGLSVEILPGTSYTANGWTTTTDDSGNSTVLPVIAAAGGLGVVILNLPLIIFVDFDFPPFNLPNFPTFKLPEFHLPCIPIFSSCTSPPVDDNPTDNSPTNSPTNSQTNSQTNSPTSSSCTATTTVSNCLVQCVSTTSSSSCASYSTTCSQTFGCSIEGTTSTTTLSSSYQTADVIEDYFTTDDLAAAQSMAIALISEQSQEACMTITTGFMLVGTPCAATALTPTPTATEPTPPPMTVTDVVTPPPTTTTTVVVVTTTDPYGCGGTDNGIACYFEQ